MSDNDLSFEVANFKNIPKSPTNGQKKSGINNVFQQLDDEVARLHDQIDSVEESIANFKAETKQKTSFYETEIQNLENKLKKAQVEADTQLSAQREKNAIELQELEQQHELEVQELETKIEETVQENNRFISHHNEAMRVKKEAEIADLRRRIELHKINLSEQNFEQTTAQVTNKMDAQARESELKAQIELLEGEIKELNVVREEDLQSSNLKVQQARVAFEARYKEQQEKLEKYKSERQKRETQMNEQINAAQKQAELELQQMENEFEATNVRARKMEAMRTKLERRNLREQQIMKQDIDSMKEAINRARELENEQMEDAKISVKKLQDAMHLTIALDQEIEKAKDDIDKIKKDNADMRKERSRLDSTLYSTRLSKFRQGK